MRSYFPAKQFHCAWMLFPCAVAASGLATAPLHAQSAQPSLPTATQPATVPLNLPFVEVRSLMTGGVETSHPTLRVTLAGGQQLALPMSADTWFWKDKTEDRSKDGSLAMRDSRWAQALLKPDLSALPRNATIDKARLEVFVGWQEKPGSAKISVHRMLADWSEQSTYVKPFPDQERSWNGMKSGVDYEAAPLASVSLAAVAKGKIAIDGLENLVRGWVQGTYPNYGVTLQMAGSAVQVNLDSREAKERITPPVALGGPDDLKLILRPDTLVLSRALLRPDDLRAAALRLFIPKPPAPDKRSGLAVTVHRLLKTEPAAPPVAGIDYEAQPVASVPLAALDKDRSLRVPGLLSALQQSLNGQGSGFLLGLQAPTTPRPLLTIQGTTAGKQQPQLEVSIVNHPKALLFDHAIKPRAGVYNQMANGHFSYGGQRLRLWGTLGAAPDADRLRKMGFNAWRMWRMPQLYSPASAQKGQVAPVAPNAEPDDYDRFFASLKQRGMFVMFAGLTSTMPLKVVATDGSFVAPAATASPAEKTDWEDWKNAVRTDDQGRLEVFYVYFDPRLQKIRKTHARNFLTHVNPLTGKSYAEDEAIALYEVFNESGFVKKVLDRGWGDWNPYFQKELQVRWNEWLTAKYKNDAGLKAAWGKVDDGEMLAGNAIKLGPISATARDYPAPRGGDFTRFLIELVNNFNLDFEKYCRSLAPRGVGVNVVPFSFDTQYMPSVQWAYQRAAGQVNCFGMYSWDLKSQLGRPPGNYVMDSHDIEGKATVIYETNQSRPDPYRTEYPFRTAALASWQDWDGIFWHYWGAAEFEKDEDYLTRAMLQLTASHYWTGVHHQNDPVMTTAMALAGRIFLSGAIAPALDPAIYEVGARSLFNFNRYNALGLTQATYSTGSRLRFKPDSDTEVIVNGGPPPEAVRITEAVRSGNGILWDWPNERLIIDTPTAKAYIGRTAPSYTFRDGITVSGFDTPFISWSLISSDGKPLVGLNATARAYLNGTFDARNTDFEYDWSVSGSPVQQANAIRNRGRAPVIVDRVSYTVSFPTKLNYDLTGYDFALRQTNASPVSASNVVRVRASDAWMNVLSVSGRGDAAPPVVDPSPGAPIAGAVGTAGATGQGADALANVFNPLPGLSWGDDYRTAHRKLREAATRFVAISPEDLSNAAVKTITWSGAEVLFDAPADFDLTFNNGRLAKIAATFKRPPDFATAVAAYEQRFGPAVEKVLDKAQFETNIGRWQIKSAGANLAITLTLAQGEMKAIYELK